MFPSISSLHKASQVAKTEIINYAEYIPISINSMLKTLAKEGISKPYYQRVRHTSKNLAHFLPILLLRRTISV